MSAVKVGRNELSRLAGGRAPKGRRGSHTHVAIMAVLFSLRGRNAPFVGQSEKRLREAVQVPMLQMYVVQLLIVQLSRLYGLLYFF